MSWHGPVQQSYIIRYTAEICDYEAITQVLVDGMLTKYCCYSLSDNNYNFSCTNFITLVD